MVIMWTNTDGSVTLSQRQASGEVEPSVVSSPPRVATSLSNLTSTSGSTPKFGYSVPVRIIPVLFTQNKMSHFGFTLILAGKFGHYAVYNLGVL